jgi:lysine 2,3-aminomutase
VPVANPERVTDELLSALKTSDSAVWLAIHCNHPDELTAEVKAALGRLADAGIPLVSQSVLLRGVNDDAAVLEALFRGLVRARVKPYYLHHGDLAPGTSHFRTGLGEGRAIVKQLRGRVSGLCQPTYVLDIPGGHGKAPIGPDHLSGDAGTGYVVEDYRGERHAYPPEASSD